MEIFKKIEKERGMVARIYSDFSLFPDSVEAHYGLNKALMLSDSAPLPRHEREFLAYTTSDLNDCTYCASHHQKAYENHKNKVHSDRQELLFKLAYDLTTKPNKSVDYLKELFLTQGFTDTEWQHAVNIVAYFNFTNRLAVGMDMKLEEGFEKSCN